MKKSIVTKYKCGTLEYTVFQVWSMVFWMLWGAQAMSITNSVFGSATPFLFRNNGLSDTFIAVIMGTVFSWMNTVINPILSTMSDNSRFKLGRRIPYLLYSAIPTAVTIAAMPFYPYLAKFLPPTLLGISTTAILLAFGAIIYHFCHLFIGILYYYLIPDVVPTELMGRFYGFFRVSTIVGGIVFSKFIFPYVASHPQIVYPAAGLFYAVAVLVLCSYVREGKYPPKEKPQKQVAWYVKTAQTLATYGKECYSKSYYWWYYIAGLAIGLSQCVHIFLNFFYLDGCNMTMQQIGEMGVYVGIVSAVSCLGAGFVVDKIGAFKSAFIAQFIMGIMYVGMGLFMKDYITALIWRLPFAAVSGLTAVAGGRILVEVFPRSKFGMMASGRNLLVSLFVGLINYPVGLFSDFLKNATPETTLMCFGYDLMPMLRGYRFVNYWGGFCYLLGALLLVYFYFAHHRKRTDKACEL